MTNIDLTKIDKPFGLLDAETQAALKAYTGPKEVFRAEGVWRCVYFPSYIPNTTYRAAPTKLPEWPAGLQPRWKWIAMDERGLIFAYEMEPWKMAKMSAWTSNGIQVCLSDLLCISFDGIPWDQAIIQRPEGV